MTLYTSKILNQRQKQLQLLLPTTVLVLFGTVHSITSNLRIHGLISPTHFETRCINNKIHHYWISKLLNKPPLYTYTHLSCDHTFPHNTTHYLLQQKLTHENKQGKHWHSVRAIMNLAHHGLLSQLEKQTAHQLPPLLQPPWSSQHRQGTLKPPSLIVVTKV